jgi:uncharacterized protein (TIGR03905 family)
MFPMTHYSPGVCNINKKNSLGYNELMYIFKTQGVCPKEIHFSLRDHVIDQIRMVGGGCPGNSELVGRLLKGRSIGEALPFLGGIDCRNETSCPDQLAQALRLVQRGELQEADPITIEVEERRDLRKIAVFADIRGNLAGLKSVLGAARLAGVEAIYSLGNLISPQGQNDAVVELAAREGIKNVQGPNDRKAANGEPLNGQGAETIRTQNRDRVLLDPLILSFQLGERQAVAFQGGFIQDLNGFSDFSPYATEIIMTCNLSDYLRDESVFPALATMTDHFRADLVLFAHTGQWKHVRLGKVDFLNVGALVQGETYEYTLLEWENDALAMQRRAIPQGNS